jgi:hypothetical protein
LVFLDFQIASYVELLLAELFLLAELEFGEKLLVPLEKGCKEVAEQAPVQWLQPRCVVADVILVVATNQIVAIANALPITLSRCEQQAGILNAPATENNPMRSGQPFLPIAITHSHADGPIAFAVEAYSNGAGLTQAADSCGGCDEGSVTIC